jgi:RNA polymerase sigma factor (sigma-70 family)
VNLQGAPADDCAHRLRFVQLWEDHYTDVLAFVARRTSDRDGAADIVAETFLAAWRRRGQLPDDVRPWLFGVARKVIANARRGDRRRAALLAKLSHEPRVSYALQPGEAGAAGRAEVAEAFNRLSDADREILALVVWEELTPREAADVLGTTAPRFSVRLHRAKHRLRQQLASIADDRRSCSAAATTNSASEIRS